MTITDLTPAAPDQTAPAVEAPSKERAAVVIVIQSWTTLWVGAVMLAVGMLAGFYGRSVLGMRAADVLPVSAAPTSAGDAPPASSAALMRTLTDNTRHFRGNPNAPVVMIEFSDFQ